MVKVVCKRTEQAIDMTTLDYEKERRKLIKLLIVDAPFDGWSLKALAKVANDAGVASWEDVSIMFPDARDIDLIRYYLRTLDDEILALAEAGEFSSPSVRGNLSKVLEVKVDDFLKNQEAYRLASLSLARYPKIAWDIVYDTSDVAWRAIGDKSNDINFYSKRYLLSAAIMATAVYALGRDVNSKEDIMAFLMRRMSDAMKAGGTFANLLPAKGGDNKKRGFKKRGFKKFDPLRINSFFKVLNNISDNLEKRSPLNQFNEFRKNIRKRNKIHRQ